MQPNDTMPCTAKAQFLRDVVKPPRESGIELLRIMAMLFIIAHHLVYNSGLSESFDYTHPSANLIWLQWIGAWGKTAINAFVIITGYFMCTSSLTARKFLKLLFQVVFYLVVIFLIFLSFGHEVATPRRLFELAGHFFRGINNGFTVSFLWFYLGIPFYNILIRHCSKRELLLLIGLLLLHFSGAATLFAAKYSFNHTFWYMTIYFIGAYVRLYPMPWMSRNRVCLPSLLGCVCFASVWMLINDWLKAGGMKVNLQYWLISDSDKILAVSIGMLCFLVFRNLRIGYSKVINTIASTTFGVLLIHANSDAMRQWLWKDLLNVPGFACYPFMTLIGKSLVCVIGVFIVCSLIDLLRIKYVEKYVMKSFGL